MRFRNSKAMLAKKPIYQISKWWARRQSSVFRSLLIAAATEAPGDPSQAAKRVWDHYYCNHQKAGAFHKLRVLDIFMGGGPPLSKARALASKWQELISIPSPGS